MCNMSYICVYFPLVFLLIASDTFKRNVESKV